MLPGGKPEAGETASDTVVRETREELGIDLDPSQLRLAGRHMAEAANEDGRQVVATVFRHPLLPVAGPTAEIEELRWLDLGRPLPDDLAPLLLTGVLPALQNRVGAVAVFTGARDGRDPRHLRLARDLGAALARSGRTLVYGGGKVGLMGAVADGALQAGGAVVGVMPQHLVDGEIAHPGLTQLDVVRTMHERKQRMADLADAFVALPGGGGTLDEFFEAWTWQQLGLHAKPVAVCGTAFWNPLLGMLDHMVDEGFVRAEDRQALVVADDPADLFTHLESWTPPRPKWRS